MKEKTLEKIKKIILEIQKNGLENIWANIIPGLNQKSFSVSFYFIKSSLNSVSVGTFTFKNLKEFKNKKEEIVKKLKEEIDFIKNNKLIQN
jgi:hypothetical protein